MYVHFFFRARKSTFGDKVREIPYILIYLAHSTFSSGIQGHPGDER